MSERGAEGILRRRAEAQKAVQEAADRRAAEATSKAIASRKADAGTVATTKPKGGRIKGAATGAAGGSVGGPGGAAAGAVTGFLSGGKSRSRKSGNKALIGEFGLCMAILLLQPLVEGGGATTKGKFMKKASATAAVFIILGFISSVGETPKRVANGIGALMTVTVILNERSAFGQLVKAMGGEPVSVGGPIKLGGKTPAPAPSTVGSGSVGSGSVGSFGQQLSLQDQFELGGNLASDAGTAANHALQSYADDPTFGLKDSDFWKHPLDTLEKWAGWLW